MKLRGLNFPVSDKENHYSIKPGHEELFGNYVFITLFHTEVFYLV